MRYITTIEWHPEHDEIQINLVPIEPDEIEPEILVEQRNEYVGRNGKVYAAKDGESYFWIWKPEGGEVWKTLKHEDVAALAIKKVLGS